MATGDRGTDSARVTVSVGDASMEFSGSGDVYRKLDEGFPVPSGDPAWTQARVAAFVGEPGLNMSGTYQRGDTGAMFWVAEQVRLTNFGSRHITWVAVEPGMGFIEAFIGTRTGDVINGDFVHLPGGRSTDAGSRDEIRLGDSDVFPARETSFSQGRGRPRDAVNARFERVKTTVRFDTFTVLWPEEGGRDVVDDEPYVWLAAATFDGASAGNLIGAAGIALVRDGTPVSKGVTGLAHSGVSHDNLGLTSGTRLVRNVPVPIPAHTGTLQTDVENFRGTDPSSDLHRSWPTLTVLAAGLEHDGVGPRLLSDITRDLPATIQAQVDAAIQGLFGAALRRIPFAAPTEEQIFEAVVGATRGLEGIVRENAMALISQRFGPRVLRAIADPDDFIGQDFQTFSMADLYPDELGRGAEHPFELTMSRPTERGAYRIRGRVIVHNGLQHVFRRPGGYSFQRLEGYLLVKPRTDLRMLPLCIWRSEARHDSFTTSNPQYTNPSGSPRTRIEPGYVLQARDAPGVLGYVFDPRHPRPSGTVPLHLWWSGEREDNYTTSARPRETEYRVPTDWPLEGYIYDPANSQPKGTYPLVRWYAPRSTDNLTTSQSDWIPT